MLYAQALLPGIRTVTVKQPEAWSSVVAVEVLRYGVGWRVNFQPAFTVVNLTGQRLHLSLAGGQSLANWRHLLGCFPTLLRKKALCLPPPEP